METLTPNKIAEITGGAYVGDDSSRNSLVQGASRDNRDIERGNLFICIQGARVDGHTFANSAFDAGAACCLAEHAISDAKGPYVLVPSTLEAIKTIAAHHRKQCNIPIVGISGSVGKTTTKEMVASTLNAKFNVLKTKDNMNNSLGVPLTLLSLDESTEAAIIEMGISDFGEMSELAAMVRPTIMILTKIGYSHLATLHDLNGVLKAKSEVFRYMGVDDAAIINGDDDLLCGYDPGIRKIMFGLNEYNDYRAENIQAIGTSGVAFDVIFHEKWMHARVPSYGNHLVMAALAATATGQELGMSDSDITKGLLSYNPLSGRAYVTETGKITLINDCYNANPNSVKAAMESLAALPGRHVAILGDMLELGEISEKLHYEVGERAAAGGVDVLICCGPMAENIIKGFRAAGGISAHYFAEKKELVASLDEIIKEGDVVLVKASHGMQFDELLPYLN